MYEYTSKIRFSEVDENLELHITALIDYFQDTSTFQSEELGMGIEYYKAQGTAWVLNSWQIDINRMPRLCEEVVIGTFPYGFSGVVGYRNFYIRTRAGEVLAAANSIWTLINTETQKPTRPSAEIIGNYKLETRLDMEYLDRKVIPFGEAKEAERISICKNQLDSNHHVNNSQYVKLAVNYLEDERKFNRVRIEYKKPAMLGDCLRPMVYEGDSSTTVSFLDEGDRVYASAEFSKRKA